MLEANMFFIELAVLFILVLIGFIRGRGMWFFFTIIFGSLVIIDLAYTNAFNVTYISGATTTVVRMPDAVVFIPIIMMAIATMSLAKLYSSSKMGAV